MTFPVCSHGGMEIDGLRECYSPDLVVNGPVHPDLCNRCPYRVENGETSKPPIRRSATATPPDRRLPCVHRGEVVRTVLCQTCPRAAKREVNVYACAMHGECTIYRNEHNTKACSKCKQRAESRIEKPAEKPSPKIEPQQITPEPESISDDRPKPKPKPAIVPPGTFIPGPNVTGFLVDSFGRSQDAMRDMYRGAACFLLASGPSLNLADKSLLEQRGILVASVNNAGIQNARPHLAFFVDAPGKFHPAIWLDPGVKKFIRRNQDGKQIRFPNGNGGWVKRGTKPANCPQTYFFREGSGFDAPTFLTRATPSWEAAWTDHRTGKNHKKRSVFLVAIRMLYWLGIRTVYLVGVDFRYRPGGTYAFSGCDKEAASCGSNNTTMGVINEWMKELRPIFESKGFRVYNTTEGSRLTAFDHVSLQDAVANVLKNFPVNSPTDGLYSGE